MGDHARPGAKLGIATALVVIVAVHAVVLFQISKRLVVPAAILVLLVALATHLGAVRWLVRRARSDDGPR